MSDFGYAKKYNMSSGIWITLATIFLLALAIRLLILVKTGWGMSDDALITLRIARNLASGVGFVYNPGSQIQSSSSPLWTLVAAGSWLLCGERTFNILPLLGCFADAIAAAGITLLAFLSDSTHLAGSPFPFLDAALPGTIYACLSTSAMIAPSGLETGLYVLAIVLTFVFFAQGHYALSAVLAASGVLLRLDGVLLVIVVLVGSSVRKRRPAFKELAIVAAVTVPFFLFALSYFGTVIPQTVTAKSLLIHSAMDQWQFFLGKFFFGSIKSILSAILFTVGAVTIIKRNTLVAILIWAGLYVAAFSTFAIWWPWYLPPAMVAFSLGVGLGAVTILRRLPIPPRLSLALRVLVILSICGVLSLQTSFLSRNTVPAAAVYEDRKEIAGWIDAHTLSDATVMLEPVGTVGYFSQRRFQDYPGLVSREVTNSLKELHASIPGKPNKPDVMIHLLGELRPTLLILREDEFAADSTGGALSDYYLVKVFPVDPAFTKLQPAYQRFYVLARLGDARFLNIEL